MKCRECNSSLKDVPVGFDAFASIMSSIKEMYCPNGVCKYFGFVTVAGKPESEEGREERIND